ncbi:hypothetical protein AMTRI_Chr01g115090 [Amborella trichopoda]
MEARIYAVIIYVASNFQDAFFFFSKQFFLDIFDTQVILDSITCEMHCLGNVAEMRDIDFQLDFLTRMLLFHLVLALVIILEVGASLLLMNLDAHYMVTFLVSNDKNDLIMRYGDIHSEKLSM